MEMEMDASLLLPRLLHRLLEFCLGVCLSFA